MAAIGSAFKPSGGANALWLLGDKGTQGVVLGTVSGGSEDWLWPSVGGEFWFFTEWCG
jgi:hypothetical protein